MSRRLPSVLPMLAAVVLAACGGGASGSPDTERGGGGPMTVEEARATIDAFRTRHGITPTPPGPAPTSLGEVLEIIRRDRFADFEGAFAFAGERQGVEALGLQSQIRLSTAGIFRVVGSILEELANRRDADRSLLVRRGEAGDDEAAAQAEQLADEVASHRRTSQAAGTLGRRALAEGEALVEEMVRRYPSEQLSFTLLASVHRLRRDWMAFDTAIRRAEGMGAATPLIDYLRALEAIERYDDRAAYTELLDALLTRDPGLVRVQAYRVFSEQDVDARHRELGRLRELAPTHPVVVLAGPVLDAEYESRREVRGAASAP